MLLNPKWVTPARLSPVQRQQQVKIWLRICSKVWFPKGMVSLIHVLCDQISRMALGVT